MKNNDDRCAEDGCGHYRDEHTGRGGRCTSGQQLDTAAWRCQCQRFQEPDPAEIPDAPTTGWVVSVNDPQGNARLLGPFRDYERAVRVQKRLDELIATHGGDQLCTVEPVHRATAEAEFLDMIIRDILRGGQT